MSKKVTGNETQLKIDPTLLPGTVVYHNAWTGLESGGVGKLFTSITAEQALKLKPGDTIWLDTEWPQGKVYGLCRGQVISVRDLDDRVMVEYKGPHSSGQKSVPKKEGYHEVNTCTDEQKLMQMVEENPLLTETGTVSTISAISRKHLEDTGMRIGLRT